MDYCSLQRAGRLVLLLVGIVAITCWIPTAHGNLSPAACAPLGVSHVLSLNENTIQYPAANSIWNHNEWTLEFWHYYPTNAGPGSVLNFIMSAWTVLDCNPPGGPGTCGGFSMALGTVTNKLTISWTDTTTTRSFFFPPFGVARNVWHHLAVSYSDANQRLRFNWNGGEAVYEGTYDNGAPSSNPFNLGFREDKPDKIIMRMSNMRLWNRELTEAEVQSVMFQKVPVPSTGLTHRWSFENTLNDVISSADVVGNDGAGFVGCAAACPADGPWPLIYPGQTAEIPCPAGFSNNRTRACQDSGWDAPVETQCAAAACASPVNVANSDQNPGCDGTLQGETCAVTCTHGFYKIGSDPQCVSPGEGFSTPLPTCAEAATLSPAQVAATFAQAESASPVSVAVDSPEAKILLGGSTMAAVVTPTAALNVFPGLIVNGTDVFATLTARGGSFASPVQPDAAHVHMDLGAEARAMGFGAGTISVRSTDGAWVFHEKLYINGYDIEGLLSSTGAVVAGGDASAGATALVAPADSPVVHLGSNVKVMFDAALNGFVTQVPVLVGGTDALQAVLDLVRQ